MNITKKRASDARRERLLKGESSSLKDLRNNLLPIERYYDIANKLFKMFEDSHLEGDIDKAYIFGKRVSTFCSTILPTHPYYLSSKRELKEMRTQNITDLQNVATTLELIVDIMDEQEIERIEMEKKAQLEKEKAARELMLSRRKKLEERNEKSKGINGLSQEKIQMQVVQKLLLLARKDKPSESVKSEKKQMNHIVPESKQIISGEIDKNLLSDVKVLPPPSFSPKSNKEDDKKDKTGTLSIWAPVENSVKNSTPSPPSYNHVLNDQHEVINHHHSNITDTPSTWSWLNNDNMSKKDNEIVSPEDSVIPIEELTEIYQKEWDSLIFQQKVEIKLFSTYQGKFNIPSKDSTNGCTVISPLIAIEYLTKTSTGMADNVIEKVIDEKCPPILRAVRTKLGLPGNALIIPSDVHDYLVDIKLLRQDMFVGVCGGNILDPLHLVEFLNMMKYGTSDKITDQTQQTSKKVAAALFFHEHVVSIIKINTSNGETWYDLIDSMPKMKANGEKGGSRTRSKSIHALEATLRTYACSKFTDTNRTYINKNMWDDVMCDFDPRVFQAFVWTTPTLL